MKKREFSEIRRYLRKTQKQMAELLGTSVKAVQSYEQGWRDVPGHVGRQALFFLAAKNSRHGKDRQCWEQEECQMDMREKCPVWEFKIGNLCWFVNGTFCQGQIQRSWQEKMKICRKCKFFQTVMTR